MGAADVPYVVAGAEHTPEFYEVFVKNGDAIDPAAAEAGVVRMATGLLERHPEVGAFVCEGTNFSTFGPAVQDATGRPFYDIVTMTHWVYHAVGEAAVLEGMLQRPARSAEVRGVRDARRCALRRVRRDDRVSQHDETIYGASTWSIRTEIHALVMGMFGMVSAGHYLAGVRGDAHARAAAATPSTPASPPG